jgi:hypothetical protein
MVIMFLKRNGIIVFTAVFLIIVGCSGPTNQGSNDRNFSNSRYGISFSYPENLLEYTAKDSILSIPGSSFTNVDLGSMYASTFVGVINLKVSWPMSKKSASDLATAIRSAYISGNAQYLSTDTATINGNTAARVYYTDSLAGLAVKNVITLITYNSTLFFMEAFCFPDDFSNFQTNILNKIWSTISLEKGTVMAKTKACAIESNLLDVMKLFATQCKDQRDFKK